MPTGYTYALIENKQTFPEFALACARAFGALIEMRDAAPDDPIPDEFPISDYHNQALLMEREKLDRLNAMSPEEAVEYGNLQKENTLASLRDSLEREMETNRILVDMKLKVLDWSPPTPDHENLKKFMLDQLDISMGDVEYYQGEIERAIEEDAIKLHTCAKESCEWAIDFHAKKQKEEIERIGSRNAWIHNLKDSLMPYYGN